MVYHTIAHKDKDFIMPGIIMYVCASHTQPQGVTWPLLLTGHLLLALYPDWFSQNLLIALITLLCGQKPHVGGTVLARVDGTVIV